MNYARFDPPLDSRGKVTFVALERAGTECEAVARRAIRSVNGLAPDACDGCGAINLWLCKCLPSLEEKSEAEK